MHGCHHLYFKRLAPNPSVSGELLFAVFAFRFSCICAQICCLLLPYSLVSIFADRHLINFSWSIKTGYSEWSNLVKFCSSVSAGQQTDLLKGQFLFCTPSASGTFQFATSPGPNWKCPIFRKALWGKRRNYAISQFLRFNNHAWQFLKLVLYLGNRFSKSISAKVWPSEVPRQTMKLWKLHVTVFGKTLLQSKNIFSIPNHLNSPHINMQLLKKNFQRPCMFHGQI